MITTTHIVTNALLVRHRRFAKGDGLLADASNARWFVAGGLAPDLGLYALTLGAAIFYPLVRGMTLRDTMQFVFNDLFFNDPLWIIAQNTLHGPVVLAALILVGKAWRRPRLLSLALGCLLHTALDIPVHHNDGPMLLFPFDWSTRFMSPISYYDADHYGQIVAPLDVGITLIGGAVLARSWWKNRASRGQTT